MLTEMSSLTTTVYPTVGINLLNIAGGGKCSFTYVAHGETPVAVSGECSITKKDLDTGCETN